MAPTVIAYNEVYNAIQNNVIAAGENEAAGVEQMKFYEVAPHLAMTEHAITIRPLCFSGKTFKARPKDLQAAGVMPEGSAGMPLRPARGRAAPVRGSLTEAAAARRAVDGARFPGLGVWRVRRWLIRPLSALVRCPCHDR